MYWDLWGSLIWSGETATKMLIYAGDEEGPLMEDLSSSFELLHEDADLHNTQGWIFRVSLSYLLVSLS